MPAERGYRELEHTADAYIEAYGPTLEAAFEEAAKALFNVMIFIEKVEPKQEDEITIEAEDKEALLMDWLSELLFRFMADGIAYRDFKIEKIEKTDKGYLLKAKAYGEPFILEKHGYKTEVKAVTYYRMEIMEGKDQCKVRFVLDL